MKRVLSTIIFTFMALLATSCVESSQKYRELQSQLDSLSIAKDRSSAELEELFATLNEIESGLTNLREAENIISIQTDSELSGNQRQQLKQDIEAISQAIEGYKKQIEKLKNESKIQSLQFKKRLETITAELEQKSILIVDLQKQLEEKDSQLRIKTQQIATLDQALSNLRSDLVSLSHEKEVQKERIESQQELLNRAFYIAGTKKELIEAKVLSKGALFRSAKISYEADQSAFIKIDIEEITEINLNAQKAKILSAHPTGTFSLEGDENGVKVLRISSPKEFWEQTKYLVIEIQ